MTQQTYRTITNGQSTVTSIDDVVSIQSQPVISWLESHAKTHQLRWLLLHFENGVIWGEWQNGSFALSTSVPTLAWSNLYQARLFNANRELFVWQGPQYPMARLIEDGVGEATEWIDEQQVLWGNRVASHGITNPGFLPLVEGSQGITHAPPIGNNAPVYREPNTKQQQTDRARLQVRHYIDEDEAGVARIYRSRLVMLLKPGE